MSAPGSDETALGTARGRFVASLPRKAVELRGVIALLTSTPAAVAPRDEMRRRLQTLYASALVFRDEALAELVKGGIERIDLAQQQGRALTMFDLESLARIVAKLPSLHRAERGVAVLTAALLDEPPPDPAAAEAAVQAALDAQLPEVTRDLELPELGDDSAETAKQAVSEELALGSLSEGEAAETGFPSPGGPVAVGSVQTVAKRVRKHPRIVEEYSERVSETLSGLSPVEAGEDRVEVPTRPSFGMRQGRGVPAAPSQPSTSVVEYGSAADQARRSQPPPAAEGRMRLSSSPIVAAGPGAGPGRAPLLQRVVRVLVLDTAERHAKVRLLLPRSGFEIAHAEDPETGLRLSRSEGPDILVAGRALAEQADFIRRLRSDPLTDFVPVVLVQGGADPLDPVAARELGADEVLTWPTQSRVLAECIGRLTGTLVDDGHALAVLPEATLAEVADRLAEEIRHGLVDSAESGLDLRVPLGGGAEVMAAAWAAVARVRAFVAQQSGGRIRFRDLPTRGGPALLALVDGDGHSPAERGAESADQSSLRERCVLVVDDDPAVVWFFAGLLREEGATVFEAHDGREALQMARSRRPDVVISDILMPELDGFALCRALQRDPLLADVPVILLSWKEDLLHRMRELQSGARGYLRKEAAGAQILGKVREVLRSRRELEQALMAGGDVRGSLEGLGLVGMLRSVAHCRPECRVTVRDAWNVFEIELRGGSMRALTRTSSDGALQRGEPALAPLLGTVTGRYVITDSRVQLKPQLEGRLDELLARGAKRLGALIEAVSGAGLLRARRVEFDLDALAVVRKQSPGPVRDLVERLHQGAAPAEVLLGSDTSAQTLEAVLIDLARRGAIRGVLGGRGDDLVAKALESRGEPAQAPLGVAPVDPDPAPAGVAADEAPLDNLEDADPEDEPELLPELDFSTRVAAEDEPKTEAAEPRATAEHASGSQKVTARVNPTRHRAGAKKAGRDASQAPPTGDAAQHARSRSQDAPGESPASGEPLRRPPPAAESGHSWAWLAMLAVLVGVGFVGARFLGSRSPDEDAAGGDVSEPSPGPTSPEEGPTAVPAPAPVRVVPDESLEPLPPGEGLIVPQDVGFQIYEGITDSTLEVAERQGLLIVGADPVRPTRLQIDGELAGTLPVKQPLDEGIHVLELQGADASRVLFVAIAPGKTWVLAKP